MATLDVFKQDPFRSITLTAALEKVPHVPDGLATMGIYVDMPVRTEELWIEDRQGSLVSFRSAIAVRTWHTAHHRARKARISPGAPAP
jgi:hypothetical protein